MYYDEHQSKSGWIEAPEVVSKLDTKKLSILTL